VIFIPMPLANEFLQTQLCSHLLSEDVVRTHLGMGTGMNVTAQAAVNVSLAEHHQNACELKFARRASPAFRVPYLTTHRATRRVS